MITLNYSFSYVTYIALILLILNFLRLMMKRLRYAEMILSFSPPIFFAMPFIQKWNESYNKFEESYCERVENITFFL